MKTARYLLLMAAYATMALIWACQSDDEAAGLDGSGSADSCVAEGEGFEAQNFVVDGRCCGDLVPINEATMTSDGCTSTRCPCFVCTACGDGVCGLGENECNCEEDCAQPEQEACEDAGELAECMQPMLGNSPCPNLYEQVDAACPSMGEVCCVPMSTEQEPCEDAGELAECMRPMLGNSPCPNLYEQVDASCPSMAEVCCVLMSTEQENCEDAGAFCNELVPGGPRCPNLYEELDLACPAVTEVCCAVPE